MESTPQKEKPKRSIRKILIWAVAALLIAGSVFLTLDAMGVFQKQSYYTFVRTDGAELTKADLAQIKTIVTARAQEIHPNGDGYGMPRLSLKEGRLEAKIPSHQVNEKGMHSLLASGQIRLLYKDGSLAADTPEIASAKVEWAGQGLFSLLLTLHNAATERIAAKSNGKPLEFRLEQNGKVMHGFNYPASVPQGNTLAVAQEYNELVSTLAAGINHPLLIPLAPTPEYFQPTSTAEATPAAPPAIPARAKPKLAQGEIFYSAAAKFDSCDSVAVSFILSADKKEIHNVTVTVANLSVTTVDGNTRITRNVGLATSTMGGITPVDNGSATVNLGSGGELSVSGLLGETEVVGGMHFLYTFYDTPSVTVDLGSAMLVFKKGL